MQHSEAWWRSKFFRVDPAESDGLELLGRQMAAWRALEGLTQAEAAERAGTSGSTWGHLERLGESGHPLRAHPSAATLRGIAAALGLSVLDVLTAGGYEHTPADIADAAVAALEQLEQLADELHRRTQTILDRVRGELDDG